MMAEEEPLFCSACNKVFNRALQYRNHMRYHTAVRKYPCVHCPKSFSQSNNLRTHLRIHTNERPYKCVECGKAFTQVTNLNNHVRLHTGERPFVCTSPGCDRAFAQVTNLNDHRKNHHRDSWSPRDASAVPRKRGRRKIERCPNPPFPPICKTCGEFFSKEKALRNHMKQGCKKILPTTDIKIESDFEGLKSKSVYFYPVDCTVLENAKKFKIL